MTQGKSLFVLLHLEGGFAPPILSKVLVFRKLNFLACIFINL